MKILNNLLSKYTQIQAPDATLKKSFVAAVEKCIGVVVETKNVQIAGTVVRVHAPSVVKSEIRLHQSDILTMVASDVGNKKVLTAIF